MSSCLKPQGEAKIEKKKAGAEKRRARGYSPGDPVCNTYAVTVL